MRLTDRPTWTVLRAHARAMGDVRIADLFAADPQRAQDFCLSACGTLFDYSKNPVSAETRRLLVNLAEDASILAQIAAMFEGRRINITEKRAVLHTALRNRSPRPVMVDG
jgi:glucose-6-phosphate isomerase